VKIDQGGPSAFFPPPHGRAEDIRILDLREVAALLDDLNLPRPVYRLWKTFLTWKGYSSTGG